jgi:hypothetical protein
VAADLVLPSHLDRLTPELSDKPRETELPEEQNIQPQMSQLKGQYGIGFSDTDRPMLPNLEIAKYFMISSAVFSKLDKCLREFNPAYTSIIKNMGLRGMMQARADRQAQNANTTATMPRDITLAGTEKEHRRKLDNNEIPPSMENMWVHHRVFLRFKNLARKFIRSKPLPHQERLEWKCVSGS